jgi:hypothetical protein
MAGVKILVDIQMPETAEKTVVPKLSVEQQVRDAIELIESGYDSIIEWKMIKRIYEDLMKRGPSRWNTRHRNLIKMIEPTLSKYGYHCGGSQYIKE